MSQPINKGSQKGKTRRPFAQQAPRSGHDLDRRQPDKALDRENLQTTKSLLDKKKKSAIGSAGRGG